MVKKNSQRFEDLDIWRDSMNLCIQIYDELRDCKDFSLKDQIQRSSVSIPSNVAEGYERQSNKDFVGFLYISKGSSGELRTQLYLAKHFKYISVEKADEFIENTVKISSMIYNLIKYRSNYGNEKKINLIVNRFSNTVNRAPLTFNQ